MINQLVDSNVKFNGKPDVQQTTFSLDGIARFVCNTFEEVLDAQVKGGWEFDAIVIGSGMYDSYSAATLYTLNKDFASKNRPRILVLETGPFLISEHVQNLTQVGALDQLVNKPIVDDNQSFLTQIDTGEGKSDLQGMTQHHQCVGGKSLFWGGWAPRLTDEDLTRENTSKKPHWPEQVVTFLRSEDGYEFIEKQIGVTPTADFVQGQFNDALRLRAQKIITDKKVPMLNGVVDAPIAVQAESPESGLFSMDKFSSLPLLLDAIRRDAGNSKGKNEDRFLFLVPQAKVIKLEVVKGRVTEVVIALKTLSGSVNNPGQQENVVRLNLKESAIVLLAGNTVNSTRLALNSFPKPTHLGPEKMGNNLMAHVRGNYFWRIRKSSLQLPEDLKKFSTSALHVTGSTSVSKPLQKGHFHFQFYALGSLGDDPEKFLYRSIPNLDDINAVKDAVTDTNIHDWIVIGNRTCGEMFGDMNADKNQHNSSFISVNPYGGQGDDIFYDNGKIIRIPKVFINLIQTENDLKVRQAQTLAAFDFIAALTGQDPKVVRNRVKNDVVQFISGKEDSMGSTYHESGTLWMGIDPDNSVTDIWGRFHHVANAYCVDQSIFPTVGSSNPVPTGLSLSRMICKHITERFHSIPLVAVEPGYQSIFDGTLDNWKMFGRGSIKALENLNIIEAGTPRSDSVLGFIIFAVKKYKNFNLRLDWKSFSIHANSGIFLRMPDPNGKNLDNVYSESIEVQIDETGKLFIPSRIGDTIYGSSLHKTGAIYNLAPATTSASKAISQHDSEGYWNTFDIYLNDEHISVKLNGTPVSSATLDQRFSEAGYIGLQCHSEIVQFRNIRVREL